MIRCALFVFAACVLLAGCDDNPTAPSTQPIVFTAMLSPANEVPSVTNAEAGGSGAAQISLDVARDTAGAVTGATATIYFQASGFPAGTRIVGAHIHTGAAGVNGPVLVNTGIVATNPSVLAGGSGEFTFGPIALPAATAQAIIANPAGFYFNIHSPLNPGGFARGQLTRIR